MLFIHPLRAVNDFSTPISQLHQGVIFLHASWSNSLIQLKALLNSLKDFPELKLLVIDIDNINAIDFLQMNGLSSHGWGETYWIKNGNVVNFMSKYNMDSVHKLIENNNLC